MPYVGPSLKTISKEEMKNIYGTNGKVNPNATPLISATVSALKSFVGSYLVTAVYCN